MLWTGQSALSKYSKMLTIVLFTRDFTRQNLQVKGVAMLFAVIRSSRYKQTFFFDVEALTPQSIYIPKAHVIISRPKC